jgi:hypothetical protein
VEITALIFPATTRETWPQDYFVDERQESEAAFRG